MSTRILRTGAFALLILSFVASSASAQISNIADTEVSPAAISWYPLTEEYDQLMLTVSGPGDFRIERVYRANELPSVSAFDRVAGDLADGSYTYELRVFPKVSDEIRKLMAESRANDDRELAARIRAMVGEQDVQNGYFTVSAGAIFAYETDEPRKATRASDPSDGMIGVGAEQIVGVSAADFVILDDLIVDGSACIGFDCVNGESFGFDTLRLKENNLRIKFDDTSTASSYPRNDWQLTANDSANGGASKFSIDDISGNRTPFTVEANAKSHSLYVDDGGRIGSRTSTPSVEIHTIDGDTPTLRLQQDGSSGFTQQTWDLAGNETNFFVRDVTNGSQLPFRIRPDAPTNSIFIDDGGEVGLGTSSPGTVYSGINSKVEITGSGNTGLTLRTTNADDTASLIFAEGTAAQWIIQSRQDLSPISGAALDSLYVFSGAGATRALTLEPNGNLILAGNCADAAGGGGCTADHVFEPDYELMSLAELAEFISENKHLPNVPSADETREKGLNLNAMNGRLLEKIEELTLYTLEQHDTITGLKGALQTRDAQVDSLTERLVRVEELLLPSGN